MVVSGAGGAVLGSTPVRRPPRAMAPRRLTSRRCASGTSGLVGNWSRKSWMSEGSVLPWTAFQNTKSERSASEPGPVGPATGCCGSGCLK